MSIGNPWKLLIKTSLSKSLILGNYINNCFSYGYHSWEWKGDNPIRSPLYALNFSLLYYLLKILQIDYPILIVKDFKIKTLCDFFLF